VNLEHHRKQAKRLLRAVDAGDPGALARARAVLGERAHTRFRLSDAQHVIAVEQGHRSWPLLRRAAERAERSPIGGTGQPPGETIIDTGLEYRPGEPVHVRVLRRERRISVSDEGAAFAGAGRRPSWRGAADRLVRKLDVNISRGGVVSLPVVPVGPPTEEVVRRIGAASLAFYQDLL
jgi:hypothetical protein